MTMRGYRESKPHSIGIAVLVAPRFRLTPALTEVNVGATPDEFELVALGEPIEYDDRHWIRVSQYEEDVPYTAKSVVDSHAGVTRFLVREDLR